jgi:hypothetical protein
MDYHRAVREASKRMKAEFLGALLLGTAFLSPLAAAQSAPAVFPLAGDWDGAYTAQGVVHHLVLHMNATPEGKMTALLDDVDLKISGDPAIGGSFDGTHLILRFFYFKPNSSTGALDYKVASYEANVDAATSAMTGLWNQEGSVPLNFRRMTRQARVPKPAPPTLFDGDWTGVEHEGRGIEIHFILHLRNTEDGLMALFDCPEEQFKGALASKVFYDQDSRQISITLGWSIFSGTMTPDGKALDTSMTEPGYHFLIHFDRLTPQPNPPRTLPRSS